MRCCRGATVAAITTPPSDKTSISHDAGVSRYVTTPLVLFECGNAVSRRPYRADVCDLRQNLVVSGDLIEPTSDDLTRAWHDFRIGPVGSAGIVDQTSFAIMRRLGITEAFSNDKHFTAAGFKVLF